MMDDNYDYNDDDGMSLIYLAFSFFSFLLLLFPLLFPLLPNEK
jgi:hypothetical protein